MITPDGRYIAFFGYTNLLPSNITPDDPHDLIVYVRDLQTGALTVASVTPDGTDDVPAGGNSLAISANGQYVAFDSDATTPMPGVSNPNGDTAYFVRDLVNGTTTLVSHDLANDGQIQGSAGDLQMTPDGQSIVFVSDDPNLAVNGVAGEDNVYRWSAATKQVELVSVNAAGTGPGDGAFDP